MTETSTTNSVFGINKDDFIILQNFVKESTKHFDDSHNIDHAMKVYLSTINIANSLQPDLTYKLESDILVYASMLHDVCDHKYPNSIPRQILIDFIISRLDDDKCNRIMKIIDNVSYSKEAKHQCERLSEPDNIHLIIIADADRLEAIGEIGIQRCKTYTLITGGKVPEDVVQHCHDKLLKLYNDNFIKTPYARQLAAPLHQIIVDYVKDNSA